MIHPDTELKYINESIGFGVFATGFIPAGTMTWVLDDLDQRLDESFAKKLDPLRWAQVSKYSYKDHEGKYVLCWDLGRFVNHSFNANCVGTAYDFSIAFRDIYPGEELTEDYRSYCCDGDFECLPENGFTPRIITTNDFWQHYQEWDLQACEGMQYFNKVKQPLGFLLNPLVREKVQAIASGFQPLDSLSSRYQKPDFAA